MYTFTYHLSEVLFWFNELSVFIVGDSAENSCSIFNSKLRQASLSTQSAFATVSACPALVKLQKIAVVWMDIISKKSVRVPDKLNYN